VIQREIERLLDGERFSMPTLHDAVWPLLARSEGISEAAIAAERILGSRDYRKLAFAIIRHVFLIELVKVPAIETTKVRFRWYDQLTEDQRFCSFDECLQIAAELLTALADGWLDNPEHLDTLHLFFQHSLLSYEAPLDYATRPAVSDSQTRIHRQGNLSWMATETMRRTLLLRKFLREAATSPDAEFFRKLLDDKVKVKTYLTDRVLTGVFKTNREKRWEVHPHSVHFADRRTCMAIEYTLVTQLCAFEGFPEASQQILQQGGILPQELQTHRCPITLDPMSFAQFREELLNPRHGKSSFQVGHLNPLKLDADADQAAGHTADNISWISADGNRVQGSLSLAQVRSLLRRIASNYEARGWV
jgi:hypothetical protein